MTAECHLPKLSQATPHHVDLDGPKMNKMVSAALLLIVLAPRYATCATPSTQ